MDAANGTDAKVLELVQTLDALKAHVAGEVAGMEAEVVRRASDAARLDFQARADALEMSIRTQIEAIRIGRMLGIGSQDLAGLVVVPVVVEPAEAGVDRYRPSSGSAFHGGEAAPGEPAFAIKLAPDARGHYGQHANIEDALRRGLPPGRYRFIGALVREEEGDVGSTT